jgi:carbamoyltransferase
MRVLGIHVGHDSSAALVEDGRIVAAVAEERLVRVKHYAGVPIRAIDYCLRVGNLRPNELDAVALASTQPSPLLGLVLDRLDDGRRLAARARDLAGVPGATPPLYVPRFIVPASVPVVCVDHHLAHAASAYYTSGRSERQLVVTLDGAGDGHSTCIWRGDGGRLEPLLQLDQRASLGWFYGAVTEGLGWWHGDGEGKTMGLAAYGDAGPCHGALDRFRPKFAGGDLVEPHQLGQPAAWTDRGAVHWHLPSAAAIRELAAVHGGAAVAAEAQRVLEEQALALIVPWLEREEVDALSCAGGVFLNVKLNQRMWATGRLRDHHVFPDAGDSGIAAGAALYVSFSGAPSQPFWPLGNLALGPDYTNDEIRRLLEERHLPFRSVVEPSGEAARLLAEGKVVGWFQGRSEAGPRALGHRSILMAARPASNKDLLNARVKRREAFRPYCPSLVAAARDRYLVGARDDPFMTTAFDVRADAQSRVPAVVHVDGTARPQIVHREREPQFWQLISQYGDIAGDPLVLNTSLNAGGEPLAVSPQDAIRCFFDSGMDALVMGELVLEKR